LGAKTAENLFLGFGCWRKGFFAKVSGKETNLFAKGLEVQILVPDDIFLRVGDVP